MHEDVFIEKNIEAGFRAIGIYPFLLSKLLHQSPSITPDSPEISSSTSTPVISFPNSILTSSPVDVNAINIANIALDNMFNQENGFPNEIFQLSHSIF